MVKIMKYFGSIYEHRRYVRLGGLFLLLLTCILFSMGDVAAALLRSKANSGTNVNIENIKGKEITIVADEWCPFTCADDNSKQGILVDIVREALSRHGVKVEYKTMPWTRAIAETRAGKHSAIVGASPEEALDFIYPSLPQAVSHLAFYSLKENPWKYDHNDKKSLEKISFGAVADYSYNKTIDEYIAKHKKEPAHVQLAYGEDALEVNIKKLMAGRIGAILEEDMVMRRYLEEKKLSDKLVRVGVLPEDRSSFLYIAFSPHDANASTYTWLIDQEMLRMLYSGRVTEIMNEYGVR